MLVSVQISDADELVNLKVGRKTFFASEWLLTEQSAVSTWGFFNQSVFGVIPGSLVQHEGHSHCCLNKVFLRWFHLYCKTLFLKGCLKNPIKMLYLSKFILLI